MRAIYRETSRGDVRVVPAALAASVCSHKGYYTNMVAQQCLRLPIVVAGTVYPMQAKGYIDTRSLQDMGAGGMSVL